jgi:hypothetical protein
MCDKFVSHIASEVFSPFILKYLFNYFAVGVSKDKFYICIFKGRPRISYSPKHFFFFALDGSELSVLTGRHCQSGHPSCDRKAPYRHQELNSRPGPSQIVVMTENSQLSAFSCK